jgi:hypothetical protein
MYLDGKISLLIPKTSILVGNVKFQSVAGEVIHKRIFHVRNASLLDYFVININVIATNHSFEVGLLDQNLPYYDKLLMKTSENSIYLILIISY